MALANPNINYEAERLKLRSIYVNSSPQSRLKVIRQRLAQPETGPTRLVTIVSGVEALARSLVINAKAKSASEIKTAYSSYRDYGPDVLVEHTLKAYGKKAPSEFFSEDTWPLFREAVNFRNLIVHECTYLGQDKYPSLIQAATEVLQTLAIIGGLD